MQLIEDVVSRLDRIEAVLSGQIADRPLTFQEAARYLDVSASHLYKLTSQNRIRHFKPNGKKLFFTKADLDAYLLRRPVKTVNEIEAEAVNRVCR
jgi:excisionase family DNA binding protein